MQGLMMDTPLLVSSMIDYAAECHGDREVISRELDGEIHRYTYRDAHLRTKKLAQAMEVDLFGRLGAEPSTSNPGYRRWIHSMIEDQVRKTTT